jgi:RNase P subunit RPR2
MEKKQAIKLSRQLKRTFCETTLNALGKHVGFCRRERELTPYRLCLGLVEAMGVSP